MELKMRDGFTKVEYTDETEQKHIFYINNCTNLLYKNLGEGEESLIGKKIDNKYVFMKNVFMK